jgi:hypothetical protein
MADLSERLIRSDCDYAYLLTSSAGLAWAQMASGRLEGDAR